jgi:hypothetical protein
VRPSEPQLADVTGAVCGPFIHSLTPPRPLRIPGTLGPVACAVVPAPLSTLRPPPLRLVSILWRRLLKHGIFTSETDLACQMLAFVETYNQTAKPFKWTYTGKVLEA